MLVIAMILCAAVLAALVLMKRAGDRDLLERHITPEDLYRLLASHHDLALFDVRLPLDCWLIPSLFLAQSVSLPKK